MASSSNSTKPALIPTMGITLKGKVLYAPDLRISKLKTDFGITHIGTKEGVTKLYLDADKLDLIQTGNFILITKCASTHDGFRTNKNSETNPIEINIEDCEQFLNPETITAEQVATSPVKRRVSVTGYIGQVYEKITQAGKKRRFVDISPAKDDNENTIKLKLWGNLAETEIPPETTKVLIKNVDVGEYHSKKDLNSTCLTEIQICDEEEEFDGTVQAIGWKRPQSTISIADIIYQIDTGLLENLTTFKTLDIIHAKVTVKRNGKILKAIKLKTEKKEKPKTKVHA